MQRSFRTGQTLRAADLRDAIPQSFRGGPGILVKHGPSGVTISATGSTSRGGTVASGPRPWDLTIREDEFGAKFASLRPGVVNDHILPTNIFSEISISGTGTEYVVLYCSAPTGYITDCAWAVDAILPGGRPIAANGLPVEAVCLLHVISDGVGYRVCPDAIRVRSAGPVLYTVRTGISDPLEPRYDLWHVWDGAPE
jgi:hypothetical protein